MMTTQLHRNPLDVYEDHCPRETCRAVSVRVVAYTNTRTGVNVAEHICANEHGWRQEWVAESWDR